MLIYLACRAWRGICTQHVYICCLVLLNFLILFEKKKNHHLMECTSWLLLKIWPAHISPHTHLITHTHLILFVVKTQFMINQNVQN